MIGADTFINPLIKIATVFAVLAAVFIFIVKPVLDSTENITRDINHTVNRSFKQANKQVQQSLDGLNKNEQTKVTKSIKGTSVKIPASSIPSSAKAQLKVAECVQKAAPDTTKMQKCVK